MDQGRSNSRTASWCVTLTCAGVLICMGASARGADAPPPDALRVRGILDRDTLWSGHVLITDDTSVLGATLTIAAGTFIEFAAAPNRARGPTLTIGAETGLSGWLTLEATSDLPIVFRTREGCEPGAIVIHARALAGRRRGPAEPPTTAGLELSNVTFEGLGGAGAAALKVYLRDRAEVVLIAGCRFECCGPLRLVQAEPASAYVANNRMTRSAGPTCIEVVADRRPRAESKASAASSQAMAANRPNAPRAVAAADTSELRIHENVLDGAILAGDVRVDIDYNVLLGDTAGIMVEGDSGGETIVQGNYVHRTARRATDGGTCLDCRDAGAAVRHNIFWGGSTVVARASRDMSHNVLIAPTNLTLENGRRVPARSLVEHLPAGATFEYNLLIGSADTMLRVSQPAAAPIGDDRADRRGDAGVTIIRNNTFDGGVVGSRGIALADASSCEVYDNVFWSTFPAVVDETLGAAKIRVLDFNARDAAPDQAYRKVRLVDGTRPGAGDVQLSPGALSARAGLTEALGKLETSLVGGEQTDTTTAIFRLRSRYAPPADSPLIGAGRPDERGARRTIGAMEP